VKRLDSCLIEDGKKQLSPAEKQRAAARYWLFQRTVEGDENEGGKNVFNEIVGRRSWNVLTDGRIGGSSFLGKRPEEYSAGSGSPDSERKRRVMFSGEAYKRKDGVRIQSNGECLLLPADAPKVWVRAKHISSKMDKRESERRPRLDGGRVKKKRGEDWSIL